MPFVCAHNVIISTVMKMLCIGVPVYLSDAKIIFASLRYISRPPAEPLKNNHCFLVHAWLDVECLYCKLPSTI